MRIIVFWGLCWAGETTISVLVSGFLAQVLPDQHVFGVGRMCPLC